MTSILSAPPDLEILRCAACGRLDPGPRELCPSCFSPNLEKVAVPGRGALVSWTLVRRPPSRFQADGPYAVAVVDLDCGVRLTGRLAEVPRDEADAPPLGARMRLSGGTAGMPLFAPEAERR
ncbi:Zn-ribbon domain-containing OB-fold protein [Xanthobacter pseudotagetidis]|uniref:Zn-ribbon domain-containing OB-fold protein n=1 Tax=Xanthobacter pseudotagetidis TaxID=3119911 RepID=UPI00372BF3F8